MAKNVLITGATGRQGGAVIQALLAASSSLHIIALTRNPDSKAAEALKSKNVELVVGDLDDCDAIFTTIAKPIWGVFSVQLGVDPKMTPAREEAQGKGLIDAARRNNVSYFVFSSADLGSPPRPTPVPQFQSKYNIERHLKESGLKYTILQPVVFFENLTTDVVGQTFAGALKYYIKPERKLQFIATEDIGWFGAEALMHPDRWPEQTIRLAGDELDFAENSRVFRRVTGRELPLPWGWWFLPWFVFHVILKDLGIMFKHFSDEGFDVDIGAVRKLHPGLLDYEQWLQRSAWAKKSS